MTWAQVEQWLVEHGLPGKIAILRGKAERPMRRFGAISLDQGSFDCGWGLGREYIWVRSTWTGGKVGILHREKGLPDA